MRLLRELPNVVSFGFVGDWILVIIVALTELAKIVGRCIPGIRRLFVRPPPYQITSKEKTEKGD